MEPFEIKQGNARIRVGYRSPGLSGIMDADGKMKLCQKLGMSVIEPQISPKEFPGLDAVRAYKDAADRHGIEILTAGIMTPTTDPAADLEFDKTVDHALVCAGILDIDYLFVLAPHPPEGIPHQKSWDLAARRFRFFADKAEARDVRLALEPEWFLGTVERVANMIRDVNHPNFQHINFDPTNFFVRGSDPCDAVTLYGKRIINGHIKDGYYQTGKTHEAPVGMGELDDKKIFNALLAAGGDVTMHIEHCGQPEQVASAAVVIRSVFESLRADTERQ